MEALAGGAFRVEGAGCMEDLLQGNRMNHGMIEPVLSHLLALRGQPLPVFDDFGRWRSSYTELCASWDRPIDRAIAGGFASDRIGYAFAAGIQAALRRLFMDLPEGAFASVCITEEGGAHPRAIETTLTRDDGGWRIDGRKKWSTLGPAADVLLVATVRGTRPDGNKDIVLVRVDARRPGVAIEAMPPTPFAPEIEHAVVRLEGVRVRDHAILPGDGYLDYIKPFRTIEDTFVSAAVCALLLRIAWASAWPEELCQRLLETLAVLHTVAGCDPKAPAVHVILDAALGELGRLTRPEGPHWDAVAPELRERWERDISIMRVASGAREKRLERALRQLGA
ncbi:MAG: acyl-CoA dehydrogenase [Deltaproteobacteria bacterium]|nr:MAG: acyl-CoA dehydrogenase [Deltaproteobacteria bacterium]